MKNPRYFMVGKLLVNRKIGNLALHGNNLFNYGCKFLLIKDVVVRG